ncbi:MAG: CHAT domain-containing protein [Bacteroidia bacterium]
MNRLLSARTIYIHYWLWLTCAALGTSLQAQSLNEDQSWKHSINARHSQVDKLLRQGAFDPALAIAKSCLGLIPEHEKPCTFQGLCFDRIALIFYQKGESDSALIFYHEARKAYEQSANPDYEELGTTFNNLGAVYGRKGKDSLAVVFHTKALAVKYQHHPDDRKSLAQSYQNLGHTYLKMSLPDSAIRYYSHALTWASHISKSQQVALIHGIASSFYVQSEFDSCKHYIYEGLKTLDGPKNLSAKNLSIYYSFKALDKEMHGDYRLAAQYYGKLISSQKAGKVSQLQRAISYERLANCHLELAQYAKAKSVIDEALRLVRNRIPDVHPFFGQLFNQLGLYYERTGDLSKSESSYQKSISVQIKLHGDSHPQVAAAYHNLGKLFFYDGDHKRAIRYYENALRAYLAPGNASNPKVARIYESLSQAYIFLQQYDQAKFYTEEALARSQNSYKGGKMAKAANQYNLGIIAFSQGQNKRAISCLKAALNLKQQIYAQAHPDLALTYLAIANAYWQDGKLGVTESYFQQTIAMFGFEEPKQYQAVTDKEGLLKALSQYGRFCLERYRHSQEESWLVAANRHLAEAIYLEKNISKVVDANFQLSISIRRMYESAIQVAYTDFQKRGDRNKLQAFIDLMDRSRAMQLRRGMQHNQALKISGIPDVLLEEEHQLRNALSGFEKQKQLLLQEGANFEQAEIMTLADTIRQLEERYDYLVGVFETQFPKYYQAKYDDSPVALHTLQKSLAGEKAIIQFFTGEQFIYTLLIRSDTIIIREINRDFPLNDWVHDLRKGVTQYHTENYPLSSLSTFTDVYIKAAVNLHKALLGPIQEHLPARLTIIPDDVLGYVPFEILLSSVPKRVTAFQDYPYLFYNHSLSYCYSLALLHEMETVQEKPSQLQTCLSVAPFSSNSNLTLLSEGPLPILKLRADSLKPLPFSRAEAEVIQRITRGESLLGDSASVQSFTSKAPHYRILHLATHAFADDKGKDYAYLAFADAASGTQFQKYYIKDIYNLSLNADMVVLSACQTGTGGLQKGEGVISLARAFAYAGAKNIATSLWQIDDQSTAVIMKSYYTFLANGLPKDVALQQAKLLFIKQHSGISAHPFFWSAFISIGDASAF